ncbi:MAG: hypothetical protein LUC30_10320 [Clostridiales bacterium]|nr:hypothetical protein [Clostridiales bacterium]
MAKVERKYMAHYLDTTFSLGDETAAWERLGTDLEEYNVEMNPDIEQGKNILGQSTFKHSGYEQSADADPFYADPDSALFLKLQDIIDNLSTGDTLKTYALEVHLWDGDATSGYTAIQQECYVQPTSYGGDTSGYQIPFTVYYVGDRTKGAFLNNAFTATT